MNQPDDRDHRPRVALVVHDVGESGGMERACTELLNRTRSVRFVVVSTSLGEGLRDRVEWRQIRVPKRPAPAKFLLFFIKAGVQLMRSRPSLVHTMGAIVPNRADIAWVQHYHAGVRERLGRLRPRERSWLRDLNSRLMGLLGILAELWCYRPKRARVLLASSNEIAVQLSRHYDPARLLVIPNGVEANLFAPDSAVRCSTRAAQGVDGSDVVVLFVGGDWERKGLQLAIEAFAQAKSRVPGLWFWIVGRGDPAPYRSLATMRATGDRVRFLGSPEDVRCYYQAADIFVLPSLYEGFSIVALEAAATALPIVGTRVGIVGELVGDDEAGILVEPTVQSLSRALVDLARDPSRRKLLGENARARARQFTWEQSTDSIAALYDRLLAEKL